LIRLPVAADVCERAQVLIAAAVLAGLSGVAGASGCDTSAFDALAGAERSRWEEFDAQGKSLVRERGTLKLAGLQASGHCGTIDWTAQWTRSQGPRSYDGFTTRQVPLETRSQLRATALNLAAWLPVTPGWAIGAQLGHRQIDRDIATSGNVLGYPEQFEYLHAALGARYQAALGQRLGLTVSGWLGAGPAGRVRVDLPRADPVTLALGSSRLLALSLQLDGGETVQTGWSWQASLNYRREQAGAGTPEALRRNGVTVGAAMQPRVVQQHLGTAANLTYRF